VTPSKFDDLCDQYREFWWRRRLARPKVLRILDIIRLLPGAVARLIREEEARLCSRDMYGAPWYLEWKASADARRKARRDELSARYPGLSEDEARERERARLFSGEAQSS
jgi:hypothetical protein